MLLTIIDLTCAVIAVWIVADWLVRDVRRWLRGIAR